MRDERALAERVRDDERLRAEERARDGLDRDHEPVVAVGERELDEQQAQQLVRVALDPGRSSTRPSSNSHQRSAAMPE